MKAEIRPKNADWEMYSLVLFFFYLTRSVGRQVSAETSQVASHRKKTCWKVKKRVKEAQNVWQKQTAPYLLG